MSIPRWESFYKCESTLLDSYRSWSSTKAEATSPKRKEEEKKANMDLTMGGAQQIAEGQDGANSES